jgi:DDE family transposase/transposase-like protein DUF772
MVALLLYGYCQGERSSRVIERRCVRDVGYRVIAGGLHPDHATIARFRARHEKALGGLFSQVLRLLAGEGMVSLGTISLDGTKLAGNAAQKANKTLPQIEKLLTEAAAADAAEDARYGDAPGEPAPRTLARTARAPGHGPGPAGGRGSGPPRRAARQAGSLGRIRGGRSPARRAAPRRRAAHQPQQHRAAGQHHRPGRAGDAQPEGLRGRVNGQLVVTGGQVIVGAMLSQHPVDRTLLHPLLDTCRQQLAEAGINPRLRTVLADSGYVSEETFARADAGGLRLHAPLAKDRGRRARAPERALHLDRLPATARARRGLRHPRGQEDYKLRARTVEPVFGQLKTCQKLTMMSRRGLAACESEWLLACAAHNLRKPHCHRLEG